MIDQKNRLFMAILISFALFASVAQANPVITPEQAGEIQQVFQAKLDQLVQGSGNALTLKGDLLVEPADTYYAVTFPHAFVNLSDNQTVDYGIFALNLVPTVNAEKWMVSMAMPTEISTKDKAGAILSKMTIGEQDFSGTWNTQIEWFETMKSQLGNIVLNDSQTDTVIKVTGLTINGNNEKGLDAKNINANGQMTMNGISAIAPDDKGVLNIANIDMIYDIADLEFSLIDQISKMVEQTKGSEFSVPLGPNFGEVTTHLVLKNLMWTTATDPDQSFKVASMATKGTYAVREEGLMDSDTQIDITGISAGADAAMMEWLPQEISSHVEISNFPRNQIADWAKDQINIQMKDQETVSKASVTVPPNMDEIKAAFVDAGTEYTVNRLQIKTPIGAGFKVAGKMTATEGAPYVATGNMMLSLTGLDLATSALQNKVSQLTQNVEGEEAPKDFISPMIAQQGLMGIMMVQGFGKTETNADGQPVTRFDISLPREGGILINGQDIGAMMGLLSIGAEKPQ